MYKDISEAVKKHPEVDVLVNFASLRSAYDATIEALNLKHVCNNGHCVQISVKEREIRQCIIVGEGDFTHIYQVGRAFR